MSWAAKKEHARKCAEENGWIETKHNKDLHQIKFIKYGKTILFNYVKMYIITQLKHPKYGDTEVKRENLSFGDIERIFNNPRYHTGKGKHTN